MAIAAGTRFNHYEVVSQLGAGGMGEVYRAHDETEPGIRLADAFAGFLRDALEGEDYAQELYREARKHGFVREV